jgi:hypothetical protein
MGHSEYDPTAKERRPWNVGRKVGAKRALKPQQGLGHPVLARPRTPATRPRDV